MQTESDENNGGLVDQDMFTVDLVVLMRAIIVSLR